MTDVEGVSLLRDINTNNPYRDNNNNREPVSSTFTSEQRRYLDILKRIFYTSCNIYLLHFFNFYNVILKSPNIRHEWFKIGLALSIAVLFVKSYMEIFEGKIRKKKVDYTNYRQTTHIAIILLIITSIAFNVALWPHYGWNSLIILGIFGFGVLLQLALIMPSYLQNILSIIALTFFLQVYN